MTFELLTLLGGEVFSAVELLLLRSLAVVNFFFVYVEQVFSNEIFRVVANTFILRVENVLP